jgi:hypothetical protein
MNYNNNKKKKKKKKKKKILILQYQGDQFEKEGNHKGILHLISVQFFLCLLLKTILELLRRQWILRMTNYGKRP